MLSGVYTHPRFLIQLVTNSCRILPSTLALVMLALETLEWAGV